MATLISDLDGTVFEFQTNNWLPGAIESLLKFQNAGHSIIFITNRSGDEVLYGNHPMGPQNTVKILREFFPNCSVIFGSQSPRILANDFGVACINHKTNAPFDYDLSAIAASVDMGKK